MKQRGVKAICDAPRDATAGEALKEMLEMNEKELPKIDLPGEGDIEPVFDKTAGKNDNTEGKTPKAKADAKAGANASAKAKATAKPKANKIEAADTKVHKLTMEFKRLKVKIGAEKDTPKLRKHADSMIESCNSCISTLDEIENDLVAEEDGEQQAKIMSLKEEEFTHCQCEMNFMKGRPVHTRTE